MADLKLTCNCIIYRQILSNWKKKNKKQDAGIYCFQKYPINRKDELNIS